MGNASSHHQGSSTFNDKYEQDKYSKTAIGATGSATEKKSPHRKMDKLRKSFRESFRRKRDKLQDVMKPQQWQVDETAVRSATCVFPVKYLGCVEVFESRGMQVCEEALKVLKNSRRRPIRASLHISGDGLRVVDEDTKGLIVDQTIEKVSFCAPDRNHDRGFSYICRDGTTRRWMCHGFLAVRDSGERLSHSLGCAFAVCLERKQRRDKECGVTMTFNIKNSTFTRTGSFHSSKIAEKGAYTDINTAVVSPQPKQNNPFAIERPRASPHLLERQGSFRGFQQLGSTSPFKRQMSLRVNDLPSNLSRQKAYLTSNPPNFFALHKNDEQLSPKENTLTTLCKELSLGLTLLGENQVDDVEIKQSDIIDNSKGISMSSDIFNQPKINQQIPLVEKAHIDYVAPVNVFNQPKLNQQIPLAEKAHIDYVAPVDIFNQPKVNQQIPLAEKDHKEYAEQVQQYEKSCNQQLLNLEHIAQSEQKSKDPFDADWASTQKKGTANTNPFLEPF